MPGKAEDDAGVRARVGQVGEAKSGFHIVLNVEGDRATGLKELSARPLKARPPVLTPGV